MSAHETEGFGQKAATKEREARVMSGWIMLPATILLYVVGPLLVAFSFINGADSTSGATRPVWSMLIGGILAIALAVLLSPGFYALQPNEARVLILFGAYKGTAKGVGFHWGNPFYSNGPATQSTGQSIWTQNKAKKDGSPARRSRRSSSATRSS